MTLKMTINIKTRKGENVEFEINKGQVVAVFATLFNFALKYVLSKINKNTTKSTLGLIVAYAYDIVLPAESRKTMTDMLEKIDKEGR